MTEAPAEPRWSRAYMATDEEYKNFWKEHLAGDGRKACFIQAIGFDPRAAAFLDSLDDAQRSRIAKALTMELQYKKAQNAIEDLVVENRASVGKHLATVQVTNKEIPIAKEQQAGTRRTQAVVGQFLATEAADCTDIIIDINSMPKSVAMTAVASALRHCDKPENRNKLNLLVVVFHDPELDRQIKQTDAFYEPFLHAEFLSEFEREDTDANHAIWMPILGEGRVGQVRKIAGAKWAPRDLCPVVPSPSRDPKAADRLILEYGSFLAGSEGSPNLGNVLRVSEENPVEAYEGFLSTIQEFVRVYKVLGGCRVLVSSHSTKLLSLAGLMAVYEARQAICPGASYAFVEGGGHKFEGTPTSNPRPYVLWLAGTPYA